MAPVRALILAVVLCGSLCSSAQDSGISVVSGQDSGVAVMSAQRPPAASKQLPQGSVTGHVYLADTRSPARGARLMVLPLSQLGFGAPDHESPANDGQPHTAVTALDGSFFLPHIAPGQYVVLAFAAGYLSALDGIDFPGGAEPNQVDLKAMEKKLMENAPTVHVRGAESASIDIDLQRGAVLAGKVIYSDGAPAGQLQLLLQKPGEPKPGAENAMDIVSMMRTLYLQQRMTTDDQGHFRISGIAPGSYLLAVTQNFEASANFGEDMVAAFNPTANSTARRLTIYSGNTLHRKDAKVYQLKAGDAVDDIEITLPLSGLRSIRGSVAGKDGTPLNYGSLDLIDTSDSTIAFHAAVEVDGQFRFSGIPEGTYELKTSNGRVFENPPNGELPDVFVQQQPQQFKPVRAFADTKVPIVVQTTDIDGLSVTLADTKIPDPPKQPQFQMPNPTGDPSQP
jgi:hypothetical protein